MSELTDLQARAIADSRAWFPGVHEGDRAAIVHFALGLGGETGEVLNLIKKWNRGSLTLHEMRSEVALELADVAIYLLDLCAELDVDLGLAIEVKRAELIRRWGDPG